MDFISVKYLEWLRRFSVELFIFIKNWSLIKVMNSTCIKQGLHFSTNSSSCHFHNHPLTVLLLYNHSASISTIFLWFYPSLSEHTWQCWQHACHPAPPTETPSNIWYASASIAQSGIKRSRQGTLGSHVLARQHNKSRIVKYDLIYSRWNDNIFNNRWKPAKCK